MSADDGCDLQSIGLGGNGITAKGMKDISRALWNNTRLESVGLGGNYLDSEAMEHFAEALKDNKSIKKAILSSNLLDDQAIAILVEGLGRNDSLETLLLAGNPFGDMGVRRLVQALSEKNSNIRVLDIHNCEVSEPTERAVVAKFSEPSSKLYLLGSHYGRQDHRVGALDKDWSPATGAAKSGGDTVVNMPAEVQNSMRGHEVF